MWRTIGVQVFFYAGVYIGGTAFFLWLVRYLGLWGVIFP